MGMNESQRRLVLVIFVYTCVEGLVVNLFYPNPIAYLPKDAMIAFLYLGMLSSQASSGSLAGLKGPIGIFAAVCVLYLAFPTPVNPIGLSVALKQRLFYIPLMFAGYHFLRGDADLVRLLRVIAWSAIPVGLFGIYLYFGGPFALRALGGGYSHIFFSTTGEAGIAFWRVPGTFNSPAQYGSYLSTVATYLVGFLLVRGLAPRDRWMILGTLVCVMPAMLVTGSRAPLLLFFVMAGLVAVLSRQFSRAGRVGLVAYFVMVISLDYLGAGVADRVSSIFTQENLDRFSGTFFGQLWISQLASNVVGEGLGTATIGARHFSPPGSIKLVESYFGILATEMGLLGVASFTTLAVAVGAMLMRLRRWMRNAPGLSIWNAGFVQLMAMLLLSMNGTAFDAIPGNLYFWFFVGVLVKMVDLERTRLMWSQFGDDQARNDG
jgi:hypothetical protein